MSRIVRRAAVGLLCALAGVAAQAGTVEVSYNPSTRWTDAGATPSERDAAVQALAATLRELGRRLPGDTMRLKVELLDVDLAGTLRPVGSGGREIRVANGGADWPSMRLRYTLMDGDRELRHGEERVSDLNYTWHGNVAAPTDPLQREKRVLVDWFEQRILGNASAP